MFKKHFHTINGPTLAGQGLFQESVSQLYALGSRINLADGRSFVYSKAGAVALVAGKLCQNAVVVANHLNCAVSAAVAAGAVVVTPTMGATAVTANQYREGFLSVNDVDGEGLYYKVKSNPAADASATCAFTLYDEIITALTTNSEVTLTKHPQDSVVVFPTTQTGAPVGVPPIPVTAAYFFWMQVKGPVPVLVDGTVVVGNGVAPSASVAGAIIPEAATLITSRVGTVLRVNADTEYALINLSIPGY